MNPKRFALFSIASLLVLPHAAPQKTTTPVAASAPTAVPSLVPYSGAAFASDGKPLTGETGVTFQIFKDEVGGEALWAETQTVAIDPTGHYKVQLGATSPNGLPSDLFATGEARWLEVQIAGQSAQSRALLASVPYALKAGDSTTLGGLPASAYALAGTKPATIASPGTPGVVTDTNSTVTTPGGTIGYVPVFSGASNIIADSLIFQGAEGIGIGDTPNATAALDVNGKSIFRGPLQVARIGNASPAAGVISNQFAFFAQAYDTATKAAVGPSFALQAEPTGNNTAAPGATLNLLYDNGFAADGSETGLYINSNGTFHFAPGQTFPGTGTGDGTITGVTAGTGLLGGGTSGNVTLSLNTAAVPLLAASNTFTGNQTVNGIASATLDVDAARDVNVDHTGVNAGTSISPGLRFGVSSGEGVTSSRTTGSANQFGLDLWTDFNPRVAITQGGNVGVNTTSPRSLLEVSATASAALGPVFTLTNLGGGVGAEAAVDFNSYTPSTTGTYNPAARIVSQDGGNFSDNLLFQSNNPTPDARNSGLQTNMIISSEGPVGVGNNSPEDTESQFVVLGINARYGVYGTAGEAVGNESGTSGGYFVGGYAPGSGEGGDGLEAFPGGTDTGSFAGYAGYFDGDIDVLGTVFGDVKDFKIDHPQDPANKYLLHTSVESSEMMDIYTGNVVTDELGLATITLPSWFESLNTDFRYQLTIVGRKAQAWISQEVQNGQFKISTDATNVKVSWQITAVRQDAYAKAHPLVVEQDKPAREKGFYEHPELYGQPQEKATSWARNPKMMQHRKAALEARKGTVRVASVN